MLSATEVSVLIQACVQEWAYEHAACVRTFYHSGPIQLDTLTPP